MAEEEDIEEFDKEHPYPDIAGIESLFKFSKFDANHIKYLSDLFVDSKLYHSSPSSFNDPFECKPLFNWPGNASEVHALRKYLINAAVINGLTRRSAESTISEAMTKPEFVREAIYNSIHKTFSEIRICSFTTNKDNLLFWSHYADSHNGFCVEYDASIFPISSAYKVNYKDEYPEAIFPSPPNALGLKPALIKSSAWEYEDEYRIIFTPEIRQPKNDGTSLILNGNEMRNVYFGVNMAEVNKQILVELIDRGPFNPGIWDVSLSKSSFELVYSEH